MRPQAAAALLLVLAASVTAIGQTPTALDEAMPLLRDVSRVALTHVRIVDGTGAPARANQTLIIDSGQLGACGSRMISAVASPHKPDAGPLWLREFASIVRPDTLLAWHRTLIAAQYDSSTRRGPGRPPIMNEIRTVIVRLANTGSSGRMSGLYEAYHHNGPWPSYVVVRKEADMRWHLSATVLSGAMGFCAS